MGSLFHAIKKYGWIIGSCILGVAILFISSKSEPKKSVVISKNDDQEQNTETSDPVEYAIVDVKGEVEKPGVYELKQGARVDDVLDLAGGFTKDADDLQVNQAQKVHDEMIVYVPGIDENSEGVVIEDGIVTEGEGKVRLNSATKDEIEELPGIGPSKADAILQYREEHGLFTGVEDLLHISGIGEKTLENLREYIQIP